MSVSSTSSSSQNSTPSISELEATRISIEKGAGFLFIKRTVLFFGEIEWRKHDAVKPLGHRSFDLGYIFSDRLTASTIGHALSTIEPSNFSNNATLLFGGDIPIVITVPKGILSTHNGISSEFQFHKMFLHAPNVANPIPLVKRSYTLLFSSRKCKWIRRPVEELKTNLYAIQSYIVDLLLNCDLLIVHGAHLPTLEITKPKLSYKEFGTSPGRKSLTYSKESL